MIPTFLELPMAEGAADGLVAFFLDNPIGAATDGRVYTVALAARS